MEWLLDLKAQVRVRHLNHLVLLDKKSIRMTPYGLCRTHLLAPLKRPRQFCLVSPVGKNASEQLKRRPAEVEMTKAWSGYRPHCHQRLSPGIVHNASGMRLHFDLTMDSAWLALLGHESVFRAPKHHLSTSRHPLADSEARYTTGKLSLAR